MTPRHSLIGCPLVSILGFDQSEDHSGRRRAHDNLLPAMQDAIPLGQANAAGIDAEIRLPNWRNALV